MGDMLTRPLFDNRMLRAAGGPDLRVGLGSALGQIASGAGGSTLGRLLTGRPMSTIFPERQADIAVEDFQRQGEIARLTDQLEFTVDKGERDGIRERITTLAEPTGTVTMQTQAAIAAGEMQTPEALAEKYADLGLTFEYAMSNEDAQIVADMKRAQMIRDAIVSRSPSGLIPTAAKFGAGLIAMATDPLEVASMFIPIVGQGGKAMAAARFGRFGGRVAVGAVEGGVGQALTEPFYYGLSRSAQLDYEMSDSLLSVGLGFAFGGGIGAVAGALARGADAGRAAPGIEPARVDIEPVRADLGPVRVDASVTRAEPLRVETVRISPEISREVSGVALRQFINDAEVDITGVIRISSPLALGDMADIGLVPKSDVEAQAVVFTPSAKRVEIAAIDSIEFLTSERLVPSEGEGWRVFDRQTGEAVYATQQRSVARKINSEKYVTIPEAAALPEINAAIKEGRAVSVRNMMDNVSEVAARRQLSGVAPRPDARDVAAELAAPKPDKLADPRASEEATLAVERPVDEETAELEAMVAQIEHTETMKADIELARQIDATTKAQREVVEAVSACLARV